MHRKFMIISFVFFSSLFFSQTGYCVPAISTIHQIEQPDGSTFAARLWGDEKAHGWETLDGYTIMKDPATRFWHYAVQPAGNRQLQPSGIVGTENATAGLGRYLRPDVPHQRSFSSSYESTSFKSIKRTPVTGTGQIPVMMVNFSDTGTTFEKEDFENILFGTGNQSMKDYYQEVSYGAFSVAPGSAGVTGWYTAAGTHDYYGENDAFGYDKHPAQLVTETVSAADAAVDFSEYDSDGDCYVDAVVIIHQGSGEEATGPWGASNIWSHKWDLFSAAYYGDGSGVYTTNDSAACGDIKINDYVIQPEILMGDIQTVGVFAHEFGHVLGLPDLYDIDYSSNGIGNWGLMSGGAWGSVDRPGDSPVHMSAWSKYILGWVDPVSVTSQLTNQTIQPAATFADVYQFFPDNQTDSKEYYLVENRQSTGFDAGLPATGLAIWHVDENMASYFNHDNSEECAPPSDCADTHYRVALVQADGFWDLERGFNEGDDGDLYPGAYQKTSFSGISDPASLLYDGSPSHVAISDITETGTTITATLALTYAITPSAGDGGTITPGQKTTIDHGGDMTFAITPQQGYKISEIYIDGVSMGAVSEYTFSDTQQDHTIGAVFTATANGDSDNSVAPSGGGSGGGGGGGCFISSIF